MAKPVKIRTACVKCGIELVIEADDKSPAAKVVKCSRCGK
jgi:predicted Zn finger-like uncharacterized protein